MQRPRARRLLLHCTCLVAAAATSARAAETWTQITAAAAFQARSSHAALAHAGRMWILGGFPWTNDVWSSTDGANWTQATASAGWTGRDGLTSVDYDNRLWVIGGYASAGRTNDVWSSADGAAWSQATARAPWSIRSNHASVVFDNRMWILGGPSRGTNDAWYSTDGATWTAATTAAPWPDRWALAAETYNGRMWIMAGQHDSNYVNDVWSSTDGTNWTQATAAAPWVRRYTVGTSVWDGRLWFMGGASPFHQNDVWYTTDGATWTQQTASPGWSQRQELTALTFDNRLWMIAGVHLTDRLNDVWVLAPDQPPACCSPTGNTLHFDGVNDLASIDDADELTLGDNATIAAWVKPEPSAQWLQRIVSKWSDNFLDQDDEYTLDFLNSDLRFVVSGTAGQTILTVPRSALPPQGQWYHVAAVLDHAAGQISLYINGELSRSAATNLSLNRNTPNRLIIGGHIDSTPADFNRYPFAGAIDEVRVWNVTRSADDLRANYCKSVDANSPGLIGYWRFNEPLGDQAVHDASTWGGYINEGWLGVSAADSDDKDPQRIELPSASDPPVITTQPISQTICGGTAATLSVVATGSSPAYQWRIGGVGIPGATTARLTFSPAAPTDTGVYDVVISNTCGSVVSDAATLLVWQPASADLNGNATRDGLDIALFVETLLRNSTGPPSLAFCAADMTGDGVVDQADVPLFITILLGS